MLKIFKAVFILSAITIPSFFHPESTAFAVEAKKNVRVSQTETTGRYQIFQGTIYPDYDLIVMIDSETGKTWVYRGGEKSGWVQQVHYNFAENEEKQTPKPEK